MDKLYQYTQILLIKFARDRVCCSRRSCHELGVSHVEVGKSLAIRVELVIIEFDELLWKERVSGQPKLTGSSARAAGTLCSQDTYSQRPRSLRQMKVVSRSSLGTHDVSGRSESSGQRILK